MADYEAPMRVFRVDVELVATAYVFATSKSAAQKLVTQRLTDTGDELTEGGMVNGRRYDAIIEDMEEDGADSLVTLSPAVTIVGPCGAPNFDLEEVDA